VDAVQCYVETCAKVLRRRVEQTGNNSELDSSRKTVLQRRWVKGNSMKEALEMDAEKHTSGKPTVEKIESSL
jgi:hypothetical protein